MEETSPKPPPVTTIRRIAFPAAAAAEAAHLAAFWPECQLAPVRRADLLALPLGAPPPVRGAGQLLRYAPGPLRSPAFNGRQRAVALLPVAGLPPCLHEAPLAAAPDATPEALARAEQFSARLAEQRLGGEPGLPDPGFSQLGLPRRAALLVLDPCRPDRAAAARAALAAAEAAAQGRPILLARDPAAAAEAAFILRPPAGARLLRARLSPWTLLDLAEDLHGAGPDMTLLAAAAGVRIAGRTVPAAPRWAALLAHLRCADPFLSRPWSAEQALDQLAQWQRAQAENRRVAVCLGMAFWKRQRIAALFAHAGGAPGFARRPAQALAEAQARHGAVAAWAGAIPPGFRAECEAAGVPLLAVEDGFVRSRGLGARFLPGAAYAVDDRGIYYDPARESALEHLLAITEFSPDLLARAARLRAAIVSRGVTKYNLHGESPVIAAPAGRQKLLVPGQVEDDASVRLGGGAIQGNLALL